jgi:hypothetical protein
MDTAIVEPIDRNGEVRGIERVDRYGRDIESLHARGRDVEMTAAVVRQQHAAAHRGHGDLIFGAGLRVHRPRAGGRRARQR